MSPLNNEPHRKLKCLYAGFTSIDTKLGMKTMNHAIETVLKNTNTHQWLPVNITISPSTVNLSYHNYTAVNLRICSIPFFGIYNKDEKICGIVQHTADDLFICHVITCHTNAMELCKTLKAACELRYQQCVDSKMFDNIKSNIDSINHVKVDQSNKQTKNKQIILINIINHIEQMKYEICKRIRQHSNWIKSCLLYSNDERLLETTKTDDTNDNDNNHNNNEQATANLYYSA
uniref:PID domain-containing protein n=1 Tax=Trichobilharzia regenti TaxID=157069 RepID=A0AA85IQY3_TRIRE|nr:unnamed protein product [Trichobilharzia regenti]